MIYVKGSYGTFVMDREVSPENNRRLYSTRTIETSVSGVRQPEKHSKSSTGWWSGSRQDDRSQSTLQRSGLRLHRNQWF